MKLIGSVVFWITIFSSIQLFAEESIPPELQGIGIDEKLGQSIDLNLQFTNELGEKVPLKSFFRDGKPVILTLVYFSCPSLCTFVLNSAGEAFTKLDWKVGEKFRVLSVSIDPKESFEIARRKKEAYVKEFKIPEEGKDWHFLTGDQANITALAAQVGFKYKWIEESKQYAHSAALFVFTPEGKLSRNLYGLVVEPKDLRFALLEAGQGHIGTLMDKFLMFCFHYDSTQKKYVVMASKIVSTGAGISFLLLLGFIGILRYRERLQQKGVKA